ncbi:MAG: helix-turn-helix transcriptional regulator, partial [Candidatus Limnocylindrales bacterium]
MPVAGSDPLFAAFGAAVRALRTRRGLTQEALAERAQLHRTYVTEVELGRRNV